MALEDLMKLSVKQGIEDCPLSGIEHYGISMSTPTSFPVPGSTLDLSGVYGGVYISAHIVSALWGISCMQIFTYFIHYPKDKAIFKILVVVLWSMLTVQLFCVIQPDYVILIISWGNPAIFEPGNPIETSVQSLMTALTALVAQCFFTYRLYIFTGRRLLFPIIFLPLIIGQLVVEAIAIHIIIINTHTKLPNQSQSTIKAFIQSPTIAVNAFPVAIDAGLAACMTYWLYKESKGAAGSHAMIVRLITLTINSGFWTASVALAALVGSIVGSAQTFAAIYYPLCSLYCNTVLANLNAREYIRDAQRSEIVLGSNLRFEAAPRSTITANASLAARSSYRPPSSGERVQPGEENIVNHEVEIAGQEMV